MAWNKNISPGAENEIHEILSSYQVMIQALLNRYLT